jgi:dihydroflavonol-4-reductase
MSKIFLTGASGFVGSRLLDAFRTRKDSVVVLDRSGSIREKLQASESDRIETLPVDLFRPELYEKALATTDIVLHLAALTGRASEQEHLRINAEGTELLLDCCRRVGVQKILFVSSIAVKFPDQTGYYYAQAKCRAEDSVRNSGLRFAIVRPTIILGRGSAILKGFEKLASLPVMPIFGNGRARVQPIYVDDLVDFFLTIVYQDLFRSETLELGGPVALTIEELLQEIRRIRRGSRSLPVHIPISVLKTALNIADGIGLGRFLPLNSGQLASFSFDGTAESNPIYESRRSSLRDVPQMLKLSFAA